MVEIIDWGPWKISWVSESTLETVGKYLSDGKIDGIGLNPYDGFLGDISLLNLLPRFNGLVVTEYCSFDYSMLAQYPHLRFLTIGPVRKQPIDFRIFSELVDLRIEWNKDDTLPSRNNQLQSLYIKAYKPKNKDLTTLEAFDNLKKLELVQSSIISLKGIKQQTGLRDLDVSYNQNLESIAPIIETKIERLHLEACRNVTDIEIIGQCSALKSVQLSGCGNLKSLSFINGCISLEEFRFVKMVILDGDMTPLLRLRSAGFINKRGYTHTSEEVTTIIDQRQRTHEPA